MPDGADEQPRRWIHLLIAVVATAAVAAFVAWLLRAGDAEPPRLAFESVEVPGEFSYLDTQRVQGYLAQIQGGTSGAVTRTTSATRSAKVAVNPGTALTGDAEVQVIDSTTRTVTPFEASQFLELLDKLDDRDLQRPVRIREVDASKSPDEFARQLMAVDEGDFVVIRYARVLLPVYAQPYDAIKQFGSLSIVTSRRGRELIQKVNDETEDRLTAYAAAIGPNPRIVFNIGARGAQDGPPYGRYALKVPPPGADEVAMKGPRFVGGCPANKRRWIQYFGSWPPTEKTNARILLPVQYALIPTEGSGLSGGSSTVMGKVARVLRPPTQSGRPRPTDVCYRDSQTLNAFELQQELLPGFLAPALRDIAGEPISRARLTTSLRSDTSAIAPAAVVLPVAIYRDGRPKDRAPLGLPVP